ncbi:MAG: imidazole glycerol phosphate synthase subunit HisF [Deltaproteobacteria bacterium RIFCSPLOWO2_01_44_7]|nr:MAG: imidazole glycerol phosphate synthase subunit HisF [Deltaproteobacteria bacterium RIFCSPHIGHO2_01_FULL_43_49]OGQ15070.1 MAG: imidazole glycerol phosphate synthase subunit HisF [Deltaproteobacteria bacterium RIFCSPHIGHO2_02_FULL_44_53]OGQ27310.1 MAG: imidazole glycerol phosphate synthase subunit HisF [Deltaproteobacteria bacterium RIFCSPHIGHO2_12_FULL_44_21]OGQ31587.1 MAG: imidazole glycerol phosphate synthase subunit HisF [Deltaproteobacteria bacterium RIFCSPLOWO2_01_FULL_45_74]OGQ38183
MLATRVIPCLLLKNGGLVKTVRFRNPTYIGDPINAVKIFNDKEVDELMILDIIATRQGKGPDFDLLSRIGREAFMPMGYGGGIRTLEEAKRILSLNFEKIIINAQALENLGFVHQLAKVCGSQSVVVAIDVKKDSLGRPRVYGHTDGQTRKIELTTYAIQVANNGAGEILLNSVDRDGTFNGYDLNLIRMVSQVVNIPVVALGGAGQLKDFAQAVQSGASAVAAGSFFVFHGKHRAVLITYPQKDELGQVLRVYEGLNQ